MVHKITRRLCNEKAFTLIEVIVSLVLVGIMAAVAGLGLVKITQGYVFARQNSETLQKAQVAMTRIVKELGAAESQSGATAITAAGPTSVTYKRREPLGSSTFITNTISISPSISGGYVYLNLNQAGNATLINNVVAGFFAYSDSAGNALTAPVAVARIRRIDVSFTVTDANNQTSTFTNSVWVNESY